MRWVVGYGNDDRMPAERKHRSGALYDGEHVAAEAAVDGAGAASESRRYSHTDSVDDLASISVYHHHMSANPLSHFHAADLAWAQRVNRTPTRQVL